jgi:acyl carrier protein
MKKVLHVALWPSAPSMSRVEPRDLVINVQKMNVQEVLTQYISEVAAKNGQAMPTLDQPLLDSDGGVVDSLSIWPLIVFVESHFGIRVEDTELMQENFRTLRALVEFIENKLHP